MNAVKLQVKMGCAFSFQISTYPKNHATTCKRDQKQKYLICTSPGTNPSFSLSTSVPFIGSKAGALSWFMLARQNKGLTLREESRFSQPLVFRCPWCRRNLATHSSHMVVSKNRVTPKWMVYNGKPY